MADQAYGLVPIYEGELSSDGRARTGSSVEAAAGLARAAQRLLAAAVVGERLGGASWEEIGAQLGITRQSAHERYAEAEARFKEELAHPENPDYTGEIGQFPYQLDWAAREPDVYARELDAWVVRHRDPDERSDTDPNPVSRGLARMDADTELAHLADRRHTLWKKHPTRPPLDELLAIAERELVLWEQIAASGGRGRARTATVAAGNARHMIAELRGELEALR